MKENKKLTTRNSSANWSVTSLGKIILSWYFLTWLTGKFYLFFEQLNSVLDYFISELIIFHLFLPYLSFFSCLLLPAFLMICL